MAAGRIQTEPRGLLKFLGMVGTGKNPVELTDAVRPTVDVTEFYGSNFLRAEFSATAAVQNVGDSAIIDVPSGEAWRTFGISFGMSVGAVGEQLRGASFIIPAAGGSIRLGEMPQIQTAVDAAAVLGGSIMFPVPIILRPGDRIGWGVRDINVAAARNSSVRALVQAFAV